MMQKILSNQLWIGGVCLLMAGALSFGFLPHHKGNTANQKKDISL